MIVQEMDKLVGALVKGLCVGFPMEREVVSDVGRVLKGAWDVARGRCEEVLRGVVGVIPEEQVDSVGKEAFLRRVEGREFSFPGFESSC